MKKPVEQMCRDLLTQAIKDRLVGLVGIWQVNDPQDRPPGELVGMKNLLNKFLREAADEMDCTEEEA